MPACSPPGGPHKLAGAAAAGERYDQLGKGYSRYRQPDPRIAALIEGALGDARTVVDVGSGTGSYEPKDRRVGAVEPSWTMIAQRMPRAAPVVRAVAERLPFADKRFDAALAILTIHHWNDPDAGLAELARVSDVQLILTWDPVVYSRFWLFEEYLPEIPEAEVRFPTLPHVTARLPVSEARVVPVPWDCTDGFCGAYWRRPEIYLDPGARSAISGIARCDPSVVRRAMRRLRRDLADGTWTRRHGSLLTLPEIDLGYRLVVAVDRRATGGRRELVPERRHDPPRTDSVAAGDVAPDGYPQ